MGVKYRIASQAEIQEWVEKLRTRFDPSSVIGFVFARHDEYMHEIPYKDGKPAKTFRYPVEAVLRRKFPAELVNRIPEGLYNNLYALCIEFRAISALTKVAKQCVDRVNWSVNRRKLKALLKALQEYRVDLEDILSRCLGRQQPSRNDAEPRPSETKLAVTELRNKLMKLEKTLDAWEEEARHSTQTRRYRELVLACDKALQNHIETRRGRAQIISAALSPCRYTGSSNPRRKQV